MASTDVLDEKTARMMRARHSFLIGLRDLKYVSQTMQLEGFSPFNNDVRTLEGIVNNLDFAIFSATEFTSELPKRPWVTD